MYYEHILLNFDFMSAGVWKFIQAEILVFFQKFIQHNIKYDKYRLAHFINLKLIPTRTVITFDYPGTLFKSQVLSAFTNGWTSFAMNCYILYSVFLKTHATFNRKDTWHCLSTCTQAIYLIEDFYLDFFKNPLLSSHLFIQSHCC